MRVLVTGSSGHLGEALARQLTDLGHVVVGVDILQSPWTTHVGSITNRDFVKSCMENVQIVFHTATLHKPHIVSHSNQSFVDVNISGTLALLEEAHVAAVTRFIFTSSTSVFGDSLIPPPGEPAVWITEDAIPIPKNIYGATKAAAEDLCQLFHRNHSLPCTILRVSRFFLEDDDSEDTRDAYSGDNSKTMEYTHRRVDIEDVVSAHMLAMQQEPYLGFRKYIISSTTPFTQNDLPLLRTDAASVFARVEPDCVDICNRFNWTIYPSIDRVYVNTRALTELGWRPKYTFHYVIQKLKSVVNVDDISVHSELARCIGTKGYHTTST